MTNEPIVLGGIPLSWAIEHLLTPESKAIVYDAIWKHHADHNKKVFKGKPTDPEPA